MTNNENKTLIFIPKDANYIEILGHRIDGFDSFETFCEHLKKYAELEEKVIRLQAEKERLKAEVKFSDYLEYETTNQIKAEAYKEFAELLDNKAMFPHEINDDYAVGLTTINNLLKEKVGEDNG